MPKFFKDVYEASCNTPNLVIDGQPYTSELFKANVKILEKLMSTDGSSIRMPRISMREALSTADASILFRKVIDDQLARPVEPAPVFSTRLAKIINVDNARSVVFPTIGAIRAAEIGETGNYPEAHPGFAEVTTEIRVSKYGVVIPVSEDVIADSQWDILALLIEAGRNAMVRLKEEICAKEFAENSTAVFNNKYNQSDPAANVPAQTSGRDAEGKFNGTLSFRDLIDAVGLLITNGYQPTDITIHPILWTVFAKDPYLQFLMLNSGQGVQTVVTGPDTIQNALPWAFNVNISSAVAYNSQDTVKIANSSSGSYSFTDITGPTTDLYISDRNSSLVILQREPLSIEEFSEPLRDIRQLKCRERMGVGLINGGLSVTAIKNICIGENNEPIYSVRTITA